MKYIKRCMTGVEVIDQENSVVEKSLKGYLNTLCLENGSTYQGRIDSMKYINDTRGLVPLFVSSDIVLLYTKNIREYDVILVNCAWILSLIEVDKSQTKVVFDDMDEIVLDVSINKLKRQIHFTKTFMDVIV